MNHIDEYLNVYKNKINEMVVKQGPTSDEIYQKLCGYNSSLISMEIEVNEIVLYIDSLVKQYISGYLKQGSAIDLVYLNKNRGQYLKYIDISFNKHLPSINESIQLYLSISPEHYKEISIEILEYLLNNKISFNCRLTKINRNDNFVIAMYSKREVLKVMEFIIHKGIQQYLNPLNPFIYQISNIGIVKDTNKTNYNRYISNIVQDYIEECILKQQNNPYTANDLQRFIANKCEEADNCIDKIMSYNAACFIYSIITKEDVFKRLNDSYAVQYNNEVFNKYQTKMKDNDYIYYLDGKEVDFHTMININMQQCLYKMYEVYKKEKPTNNYQLNSSIVNTMLSELDDILSFDKCNIFLSYTNKKIQKFIPYLYASIASKYKHCNEEECRRIIDVIQKRITFLDKVENNIYNYIVDSQTVLSSVSMIQSSEGLCAIEYIDEEEQIVNIKIIKNGEVISYLNVYIDVDSEILKDSTNYYGRLYRSAIANALLDEERNKKTLEIRKSDFGAKFITDHDDEVNKYVNINSIKTIYHTNK